MQPNTRTTLCSPRALGAALLCLLVLAAAPPGSADVGAVSQDSLLASVRWLADDAREGRMTGEPGAEAAAAWIAGKFRSYGLVPAGDHGTYLQNFDVAVGVGYGEGNAFSLSGSEELEALGSLEMETDYIPFSFSESGEIDAPLVFAGYGISADEYGYDDYDGLDVEGKAVLVLRHEPQQDDKESVFNGTSHTPHATFRTKARTAHDHGAVAMILVTGPASREYNEDKLSAPEWGQAIGGGDVLAVHVRKEIGEAVLQSAGIDVSEWVKAVDADLKPRSSDLGGKIDVHLSVSMNKQEKPTANVIGMIPGSDPHAGAVILGAHYDHLGRGNSSSLAPDSMGEIHNGADDNASGTSGLIELARVFSEETAPARTLVFAAFTGEEMGLIGSSHMTGDSPVPLDQVQAMINMDMIGRPRDEVLTVGGVGTSPEFGPLLDRVEQEITLKLSRSQSGYGASDHTAFYVKNVPVLFFFSGLHEDYHKPSDDWDKIDGPGITEAVRAVYLTVEDLATRGERVEFTQAAEDSASNPHGAGVPSGRGYGPYLGTIPDFGDQENGVKLAGVRPESPADKAGIQGGDVVVRFDGREIGDLYDYTDALRAHEPGDTVDIVVLREGKEVTVTATLGSRE